MDIKNNLQKLPKKLTSIITKKEKLDICFAQKFRTTYFIYLELLEPLNLNTFHPIYSPKISECVKF